MIIKTKYDIGQWLYLTSDPDQNRRLCVKINCNQNGQMYALAFGATESWHYDIEISDEVDQLKKVTS